MQAHQAHRLPWAAVGQVYRHWKREPHPGNQTKFYATERQRRGVGHFARCLADALNEFAETDQTNLEDENGNSLNPEDWGIYPTSRGGYMGYYKSLLNGYIELNLILLDASTFLPLTVYPSGSLDWFLCTLADNCDGGHPEWISDRFRRALTFSENHSGFQFKPLTADVMQIIRDHAALLFRCLYSISGVNRAMDAGFVYTLITENMYGRPDWDYDAVDVRRLKAIRSEMTEENVADVDS